MLIDPFHNLFFVILIAKVVNVVGIVAAFIGDVPRGGGNQDKKVGATKIRVGAGESMRLL
jgi:hypothetical protein